MNTRKKLSAELRHLSMPLVDFLRKNYDTNTRIVIDQGCVTVYSGEINASFPKNMDMELFYK